MAKKKLRGSTAVNLSAQQMCHRNTRDKSESPAETNKENVRGDGHNPRLLVLTDAMRLRAPIPSVDSGCGF
jgi:hypothetical protein